MAAPLDANAVYVTPTGRRCKWVPFVGSRNSNTSRAFFRYLGIDTAMTEGFTLAPQNYGILRKEGEHATAR